MLKTTIRRKLCRSLNKAYLDAYNRVPDIFDFGLLFAFIIFILILLIYFNDNTNIQSRSHGQINVSVQNLPEIKYAIHPLGYMFRRCSTDNAYNVSYIRMPKSGSTSIRSLLPILSDDCQGFVFTFIRHPLYRLTSAYTTIADIRNEIAYKPRIFGVPLPQQNDTMDVWRKHFNEEINVILKTMMAHYNNDSSFVWNQHLVKQTDMIRAANVNTLDYIGCLYDFNEHTSSDTKIKMKKMTMADFRHVHQQTKMPSFAIKEMPKLHDHRDSNGGKVPKNAAEYRHVKYLTKENKQLAVEFFKDDIEMFDKYCLQKLDFDFGDIYNFGT